MQAQERVLSHQEEQALLKAYIAEWRKFFTQCNYLPMPFGQLETALQVPDRLRSQRNSKTKLNNSLFQGKTSGPVSKKTTSDESVVKKLMLDSWNQSIFSNIKQRLQVCCCCCYLYYCYLCYCNLCYSIFYYTNNSPGLCDEAGACREDWRGLRQPTGQDQTFLEIWLEPDQPPR